MTLSERRDPQALLRDVAALAGRWTLDSPRSTVKLRTWHAWGRKPVDGVFRTVAGQGTVTPDGKISGTLSVAAASIDTDHAKRDGHLLGRHFLAVEQYPDIVFELDGITPDADRVNVAGTLTVRDRTLPISFPAQISVGAGEVTLDGVVLIDRRDFGITHNILGISGMENTLTLHAVFTMH
ncbi:YceI family protein [Streptomyces sp. NPDC088341]|uniref:YceI family protein n=1 Tax=Streptomyces sp. NPDC088341 TaxID=3154870 RepID=UPI003417019F